MTMASKTALAPGTAPEVSATVPATALVESLLAPPEVRQTFGTVEDKDGRHALVRVGGELVRAARSKSCLVEPAIGDTVLVARSEHHGSYVLAVLASPDDAPETTVEVEGDLRLRSRSGKVAISADDTVSVVAGKTIAVTAPAVVAKTTKATLFSDSLSYIGKTIDAQVDRVRQIGRSLESVFDTATTKVKHCFRTVEGVERVQANEMHVRVESTLNVHGKNTLMTAEKLVKFDGEQIHLG